MKVTREKVKSSNRPAFNQLGKMSAPILVVCEPPSQEQWKAGNVLAPTALDLFRHSVAERELSTKLFSFITAATPLPRFAEGIAKRENDHLAAFHEEFLKRVSDRTNIKLILPMGPLATRQVINAPVKITKVRGLVQKSKTFGDVPVLPTLSPGHVLRQPMLEDFLRVDLDTLARIYDNDYAYDFGAVTVEANKYQWVNGDELLRAYHRAKPNAICYDTETIGGKWHEGAVPILTQFSWYNQKGQLEVYECPVHDCFMNKKLHGKYAIEAGQAKHNLKCVKRLIEHDGYDTQYTGHNLKYDAHISLNVGIRFPLNRWMHDTLQLAFATNENLRRKNLDDATKLWFPALAGYADEFNRDPVHQDKSRMDLVPAARMIPYGGGDVHAGMELCVNLAETVGRDEKQMRCYELQMRALRMFVGMERGGVRIDKTKLKEFGVVATKEETKLYKELIAQVHPRIRRKHMEAAGAVKGLSFNRKPFLLDILFQHEDGFRFESKTATKGTKNLDPEDQIPSTSKKDQLPYFDDEPWVRKLIQYQEVKTLNNNFVGKEWDEKKKGPKGIWKYIASDGCIHPSYFLDVAVTGRTNSREPNGQNFPKRGKLAKAYRQIFVPGDGYVFGEVDLSQAELRVAAWMARERTMIELYLQDEDIHSVTGALIAGIPIKKFKQGKADTRFLKECYHEWAGAAKWLAEFRDNKERDKQKVEDYIANLRQRAKAVNFGFLYGMGWRKFRAYAKTDYGVQFTEEEAQDVRDRFFEKYPMLEEWHYEMRAFVKKYGYVRALHGALRRLPNIRSNDEMVRGAAERQAINSPVQRFASDLGLMGAVRFDADCPKEIAQISMFIHDAVIIRIKEGYEEEVLSAVKWYMQNPPLREWFGMKEPPLPIIADAAYGANLGNMQKADHFKACKPSFYKSGKGHNYGKRIAA